MRRFLLLYRSMVGKKAIVAATGAFLLGFLVLHVVGNLKVFLPDPIPGVPDIDVYSRFLRTMGEPLLPHAGALWLFRLVLAGALALHLVCVFQLALQNRRARPVGYENVSYLEASTSARWMLWTGSLLLLFVIFHVLHFTTGSIDPARFTHGAVYENLYLAFREWYWAVVYVVALAVLSLHLHHGTWSLFQSLGLDNPDRNRGLRRLAAVLAVALPIFFAAVPLAFLSGRMEPPPTSEQDVWGSR